jgi:hypothetical protein
VDSPAFMEDDEIEVEGEPAEVLPVQLSARSAVSA